MKNFILTVVLLIAISIASFAKDKEFIAEGKTYSAIGDYKIEMADAPAIINGEKLKTYIITYQNSPLEITVAIKEEKKCKSFIVLSQKLNVKYVCNKKFFGVEKLNIKDDGYETSDNSLNQDEYFHQKIITSGNNNELDNTRMIAAYFHALIKS